MASILQTPELRCQWIADFAIFNVNIELNHAVSTRLLFYSAVYILCLRYMLLSQAKKWKRNPERLLKTLISCINLDNEWSLLRLFTRHGITCTLGWSICPGSIPHRLASLFIGSHVSAWVEWTLKWSANIIRLSIIPVLWYISDNRCEADYKIITRCTVCPAWEPLCSTRPFIHLMILLFTFILDWWLKSAW